jgi:hypothetical protein
MSLVVVTAALVAISGLKAADDMFDGKIVSVGDGKVMVLGKTAADTRTFTVTAETKITRNGKSAKLTDLQPGDKVMVSASGTGDTPVAKEIAATAPE